MAAKRQFAGLLRNWTSHYRLPVRPAVQNAFVTDIDENYRNAKPFNEIPGPKGLPYIGTLMQFKRGKYYIIIL